MPKGAAEADSVSWRGPATEVAASKAAGKRPITVDLDAKPVSKRGRQTEVPRAVFAVEDENELAKHITIT